MLEFTKGKWLIHEGYFDGITLNPKQYHIYPDSGEPYTDDFIVCAEEADAKLAANAPAMYEALKECADFTEDIICRNCADCSLKLDAEDLRDSLEDLFTRIENVEIHDALFEDD